MMVPACRCSEAAVMLWPPIKFSLCVPLDFISCRMFWVPFGYSLWLSMAVRRVKTLT